MLVLLENAHRVVEKDELLERIWADTFVEEATLARNVSWLRKKLGAGEGGADLIETVPKRGYRFAGEVCVGDTSETAPVVEEQTLTRITIEENVSLTDDSLGDAAAKKLGGAEHRIVALPNAAASPRGRIPTSLWLAFGALTMAVVGFVAYQKISDKKSNVQMVARVAPFSGLAGREDFPAFSPDGRQMAFAWNGGDDGDNLDVYV
ncbi:MAG: winged helix-turn-helix domain-containing protein, partial [Pyrinomonadaceae bacterium]